MWVRIYKYKFEMIAEGRSNQLVYRASGFIMEKP